MDAITNLAGIGFAYVVTCAAAHDAPPQVRLMAKSRAKNSDTKVTSTPIDLVVITALEEERDPAGQADQPGGHRQRVHRHVHRFQVLIDDPTLPSSAGVRLAPTAGSTARS
jgi:hypothetical protein